LSQDLYPRHLTASLAEALEGARVVNLVGPRQAGKTTLVRDLFAHGRYVTLDDDGVRAAIEADPFGQIEALAEAAGAAPVVIDEVQRAPGIALAIKRLVDERRRMGQIVLTGSSNLFTTAAVADSLAGRIETLTLLPLSAAEMHRAPPCRILDLAGGLVGDRPGADLMSLGDTHAVPRATSLDLVVRGGYPELHSLADRTRNRRYRGYLDSVVERDVATVLAIRKTDALRRMVEQLAARTASELHVAAVAGLVGVQRPTAEAYIDVLERLSIVRRLGAWASGEMKREVRAPKLHFLDTGLAAAIRDLTAASFAPDANPGALGGLLESFVFAELIKSLPHQELNWRLYHWRSQKAQEIDIVAEAAPRSLVLIETKASATVGDADLRHLRWFVREGPGRSRQTTGLLFYLGERLLSFGEGIYALPLATLWAPRGGPRRATGQTGSGQA
jgi:uncharacterized protein